jgi:two-component system KDP operon response regulator KdpE
MSEKILIVDDEPRVSRLVTEILTAVGFEVMAAASGKTAIEQVALQQPDLVLLDVLMPSGIDGFEVCSRLREFSDVPIIMLTAKARDSDILRGFDVGADDYLTKPFNAQELVARVKAVLRRTGRHEHPTTSVVSCGDLVIDLARRSVSVGDRSVALTRTEFELLRHLALNSNRVLSHEQLLTEVWGPEYRNDLDYLRAYVRYLRRKLEPDPSNPAIIVTSPGVGYMLACPEDS